MWSGSYYRGHGIWVGKGPSKEGAPSRGNSTCKGSEAGEEHKWRKVPLDDAASLARLRSMGVPVSRAAPWIKAGGGQMVRATCTKHPELSPVSPQLSPQGPESQPGSHVIELHGSSSGFSVFSSDWCLSLSRAPQTRARPRALRQTRQPKCSRPSSPCTPCQAWPPS